ncbi:C40 family peptidase [Aneurinibacillus terranovensis]|uniref:C40 family peptidase n=1 Tax=Aneurinibacillus terranovensis TaxID=278991 RepID=UPI00040E59B6|nr:C40 family peptidase [Aneurinibacillus terranovensis]
MKKKLAGIVLLSMAIASPVSAASYSVTKTDTLYKISRQYHVSVAELKKANGLTSDTIMDGQVLIIPGSAKPDIPKGAKSTKPGTAATAKVNSSKSSSKTSGKTSSKASSKNFSQNSSKGSGKTTKSVAAKSTEAPTDNGVQTLASRSVSRTFYEPSFSADNSVMNDGGGENQGAHGNAATNAAGAPAADVSQADVHTGNNTSTNTYNNQVPENSGRVGEIVSPLLGVPYKLGGNTPDEGFDCSGFTSYVYSQLGITLPRISSDQYTMGTDVPNKEDLKPGDLLFFDSMNKGMVTHVGIYLGDNKMAHSGSDKVTVEDLTWYFNHYPFYGAKRFL